MRAAFALAITTSVLLACAIEVDGAMGKRCITANDCPEPLVCVAARPGEGRTCEALDLPQQGTIGDADAGVVYYCGAVEQTLDTYCAACHGTDRSGSGNLPFRLDVYEDDPDAGLQGAFTKAPRIKVRTVDFRDMPPPGSPQPSEEERQLIGAWVRSGAQLCGAADGGTDLDGGM